MEIVRCFWIVLADAGNRIKNAWFDQWAWEHKQGMKLHIFTVAPPRVETYIPTQIVISHSSIFVGATALLHQHM